MQLAREYSFWTVKTSAGSLGLGAVGDRISLPTEMDLTSYDIAYMTRVLGMKKGVGHTTSV